ncbi:lipase 1-like [Vanessa tameamea]|uniref:Lipase n=1 Tax=Vanessa tameamea TaxID=334116 RepID=A0ABM4ANC6_VANTA
MFKLFIINVITVCKCLVLLSSILITASKQDTNINVLDLSAKYGHPATSHDVTTEDGYILQLFHIPVQTQQKRPVLLMHGMTDTADTWLVRGNGSLAITLANAGYDVWLGNCRGNRYARRHTYLDPDKDSSFWDFSFHDHGVYDLPAIIDKILELTGSKKIDAIGHSQGNTIFYVLGSSKPEYNAKVNLMIALAPVGYLHNIGSPLSDIFSIFPKLNKILKTLNVHELFNKKTLPGKILNVVCSSDIGYEMCVERFLFEITGFDPEEFGQDFFEIINTYFPSSTSRKNIDHFAQVYNRKSFAKYDYGYRNKAIYNAREPPQYNLGNVTMKIAFIVALNDKLTPLKDVNILRKQLPNLVNYTVSPRKTFNHISFVWGENMDEYLFPFIFDLLKTYN